MVFEGRSGPGFKEFRSIYFNERRGEASKADRATLQATLFTWEGVETPRERSGVFGLPERGR